MHKQPFIYANRISKLATSLGLAMGFAITAGAQYMPTNTIDFVEYNGISSPAALTSTDIQPLQGMPEGITATFKWSGWSFYALADWPAWGDTYVNPHGATAGCDCRGGSSITFTSPVIIWSLDLFNGHWSAGTIKVTGKKAGAVVWAFDWGNSSAWWLTVTNGAAMPIDELYLECPDWNTRLSHILISDATGAPDVQHPLITSFAVTPNTPFRVEGSPVSLSWIVRPYSTVAIDNDVGNMTFNTDENGLGSITVSPTNTTTYTLTSVDEYDSTQVKTAKITVQGSSLPGTTGFLTFEDIDTTKPFSTAYNWNAPAGIQLVWTGWGPAGSSVGAPSTPKAVFPTQWPLTSTNSLGLTNNATLQFTDGNQNPAPVMLNSFAVSLQQLSWATNTTDNGGWGRCVVEGKLAGVVQWTWDECAEGHDWENIVTKGAGMQIDEVDFSGQFYPYDNFALSTAKFPTPVLATPVAQNGNVQLSWRSVTDWASYLVMKTDSLTNQWYRAGVAMPGKTGATNNYSEAATTTGFYRVLRVP